MKKLLNVRLKSGASYPLLHGGGGGAEALATLWDRSKWRQAAIIGDSNTAPLFSSRLAEALRPITDEVIEIDFPAGEENKTREVKAQIEDQLLEAGLERSSCLVGVGGGVTLDMVGFVAATYLRGVDHINVATSLLAQVDAAIGGKTGVNAPAGKNLVGAFHQPKAVLLDHDALSTLPEKEMRNGLAETVKHAVIGDGELFEALERWAASGETYPGDFTPRSAVIKVEVVERDEREASLRQVLNLGHTAGHAMERAMDYRLSHGAAVAAGMVVEVLVAEELLDFSKGDTKRLRSLLEALRLPTKPPCSFSEAEAHLRHAKKATSGNIRCALPLGIGLMDEAGGDFARSVPSELLARAWTRALG